MLSYTPAGFRNLLRISHNQHLLVEGKDDKIAFKLLLDELDEPQTVTILSAEIISGPAGNREKVEAICRSVSGHPLAAKVVGFTDREFREFARNPGFSDQLKTHRVADRLVWSRGHSIENYCFDLEIIRDAFGGYTEYYTKALALLESHFESVLRLGCAATLTGLDFNNRLNLIQDSVDWEIVDIQPSTITLDVTGWQDRLQSRFKLQPSQAAHLITRFDAWHTRIKNADIQFARWFCHGHIGLAFISEIYARCIFEVCAHLDEKARRTEVNRFRSDGYITQFNNCLKTWSRGIKGSQYEYPKPVFNLLGMSL